MLAHLAYAHTRALFQKGKRKCDFKKQSCGKQGKLIKPAASGFCFEIQIIDASKQRGRQQRKVETLLQSCTVIDSLVVHAEDVVQVVLLCFIFNQRFHLQETHRCESLHVHKAGSHHLHATKCSSMLWSCPVRT